MKTCQASTSMQRTAKALLAVMAVTAAMTFLSACEGTVHRHENRVDRRVDRTGDRYERRDDRRGDRYERRDDRRGDRYERWN